ncbi:hypothetical protein EP30_09470 [Bifidobacterium sp. UTCIF-39]|nr:hypothetical protein EP30_09470 [Bifidobacterium sp. UTCIF-39]
MPSLRDPITFCFYYEVSRSFRLINHQGMQRITSISHILFNVDEHSLVPMLCGKNALDILHDKYGWS